MSPQKEHNGKCIDCNRKFRPLNASAELFPDQPKHHGRGRCAMCWNRKNRPSTKPVSAKIQRVATAALLRDPQHMARLIIERARFEEDRTRRGIPPTGINAIRLVHTSRSLPISKAA